MNASLVQQLLVTHQLDQLLPVFTEHDIPAILLKGTAFWTSIYEFGERPVSDIDLLVREQDMARAGKLLLEQGYQRHTDQARPATVREFYNHGFIPPPGKNQTFIEVHRCLTHPIRYDIDLSGLFQRAEPCTSGRVKALRLCPEDSLLHLAIHRSVHGRGFSDDPRNLEDAHRLIESFTIDWQALLARARIWGCTTVAWILFDSIVQRHATRVPVETLKQLLPSPARWQLLRRTLRRGNGAWTFSWPKMPGWQRRFALLPLQLDRPGQLARTVRFYGAIRVLDFWESRLCRGAATRSWAR